MDEATITVIPVPGGWAVQPGDGEATLFFQGGRAEAHARKLAQASWKAGAPARVLVHNREGVLVGSWEIGPFGESQVTH
ncbi:hypothetical protein [Phenylobacterium deserti]|uniref:DUF2188 domain-containing protein n=1 Tax=Phenylobacterium deserti TaxID=1914756 RepID=A0A328AQ32_9CAUL|nr:hypothetical protein [Phenylobacterium deserti]RAK57110.1 hypothetical protein DJ018_03905 [Phenylobacterium deserti]